MSTRGVKFNFYPGEFVLCFEPDPTKARVIYEAKILDTTVYHDTEGKRQAGYHIHFLRWNQSWDRVVNDCFVLKDTEANRRLMKQLADVARKVRKNRTRRNKIKEILAEAFNGKPPPFESETDESDGETTTDTNDTGDEGSATESDSVSSESRNEEQKRVQHPNVELEIPESLKIVLDKDYFAINQDKKVVKLPAEINVVTVLESFVKTFMLDFWNPAFDRSHFCHTPPKIAIERILPMCKEFVDGLKICFDFVLPLILLYTPETSQHHKIIALYKHKSPAKQKVQTEDSPLIQSPRSRSTARSSLAVDEPSPKLPKLSPNVFCDEDNDDNEVTFMSHQQSTPRRVTRSTIHDSTKKEDTEKAGDKSHKTEKQNDTSSSMEKKSSSDRKFDKHEAQVKSIKTRRSSDRGDDGLRRRALRNYCKSSDTSSDSDQSKSETVLPETLKSVAVKTEKSERPPPLLIPCNILSTKQNDAEKGLEKRAPGSTDSLGESGKEEILNNILSWQMLPPEVLSNLPTPPSLLYGAHHLLRLFVKLPDLLSQMDIDENKLGVLLKLLQQFLIYLSEHLVELFPDDAYVSAADA